MSAHLSCNGREVTCIMMLIVTLLQNSKTGKYFNDHCGGLAIYNKMCLCHEILSNN